MNHNLISYNTSNPNSQYPSRLIASEMDSKEFLYSVVTAGGILFYAIVRFLRMIKTDWFYDPRYEWYKIYIIHLVVLLVLAAIIVLFIPEIKWFNAMLAAFIIFFEYEVIVDYDIGGFNFRMTIFNFTILLLIMSTKFFWTRLIIIISRIIWLIMWGLYIIAFIRLLHVYNHNIAFLYLSLVSLLLITMTLSLETFEVLSVVASKLLFLPSALILLCSIYTAFASGSDSVIFNLIVLFPMVPLSISCYSFCRVQLVSNKPRKLNLKTGMCRVLAVTPFILLAILYYKFIILIGRT